MKILLSAYACEPGRGSEPGAGWEWVESLSATHTLWVITRANNRPVIEAASPPREIRFVYVDLPPYLRFWKKKGRGVNLYYLLWQWVAWWKARRIVRQERIDLAHHVTLMSVTRFSFVPLLGIPSIIGPVGGLQTVPPGGRPLIRHRFREWVRDAVVATLAWNPLFRLSMRRVSRLVLATNSGRAALPPAIDAKAIGPFQIAAPPAPPPAANLPPPGWITGHFRVLWSGRLEDHKGLELLIHAVHQLQRENAPVLADLQVIITGNGPERTGYERRIREGGLEAFFHFAGFLPREEYEALWHYSDVFVFTSLRETTGVALIEAMGRGKPVVVIDNGGPGEMVAPDGGIRVACSTLEEAVGGFARALSELHASPSLRARLGRNAKALVEANFTWEAVSARMRALYEEVAASPGRSG